MQNFHELFSEKLQLLHLDFCIYQLNNLDNKN